MSEKLVRDNMPDLCDSTPGWTKMNYRVAEHSEMPDLLAKKFIEESKETIEAIKTLNFDAIAHEMADLLEVMEAIQETLGIDPYTVNFIKNAKAKHRGAFKNRIVWDGKK